MNPSKINNLSPTRGVYAKSPISLIENKTNQQNQKPVQLKDKAAQGLTNKNQNIIIEPQVRLHRQSNSSSGSKQSMHSITRISDLGSSKLFQGIDSLNSTSVIGSDKSINQTVQLSKSGQKPFQRSNRRKLENLAQTKSSNIKAIKVEVNTTPTNIKTLNTGQISPNTTSGYVYRPKSSVITQKNVITGKKQQIERIQTFPIKNIIEPLIAQTQKKPVGTYKYQRKTKQQILKSALIQKQQQKKAAFIPQNTIEVKVSTPIKQTIRYPPAQNHQSPKVIQLQKVQQKYPIKAGGYVYQPRGKPTITISQKFSDNIIEKNQSQTQTSTSNPIKPIIKETIKPIFEPIKPIIEPLKPIIQPVKTIIEPLVKPTQLLRPVEKIQVKRPVYNRKIQETPDDVGSEKAQKIIVKPLISIDSQKAFVKTSINVTTQKKNIKPLTNTVQKTLIKQSISEQKQKQAKMQPKIMSSLKNKILSSAFNVLNILCRKRQKKLINSAFINLKQKNQIILIKKKYGNILLKSLVTLSESYKRNLLISSLIQLKKNSLFVLQQNNELENSKVSVRSIKKSKQPKQIKDLQNIRYKMKKPLIIVLNSIFKQKVRQVLLNKLVPKLKNSNLSSKKYTIFNSLNQLFDRKSKETQKMVFKTLKFFYHFIIKRKYQNVLGLLETKSKKLSNQDIVKYFDKIFQSKRKLAIDQQRKITAQNILITKVAAKNTSNPIKSSSIKDQGLKLISVKRQIQQFQSKIKQQTKKTEQKVSQILQSHNELKNKVTQLKKKTLQKQKQNQQLKQKINKFQIFKENNLNKKSNQNQQLIHQQYFNSNLQRKYQITDQQGNIIFNILTNIYMSLLLQKQHNQSQFNQFNRNQSQFNQTLTVEEFLTKFSNRNIFLKDAYNHITNQSTSNQVSSQNQMLYQNIKQVLHQVNLTNQNSFLKNQIANYQSIFCESQIKDQQKIQRTIQELDAINCLSKNYIKQRYLWSCIKKNISIY